MRKILVPTDFSVCAHAATEVAVELALKYKAEIYFLHISPEPVLVTHVPNVQGELQAEELSHAKSELAQLIIHTERKGVRATPILVQDSGNEKIENYVAPYEIDLIVMGSHGVKGIREFILGSNTQRLVRHVHVPVLVIKESPRSFSIKNILFASAFQSDNMAQFNVVAELARVWNATINIVFINFNDNLIPFETAKTKMEALAVLYPDLTFTYNVAETNDEEFAIRQFADKVKADVIALTIYEKSSFVKFISHRAAESLVNHERRPVLVLNC
jgi:nucleotide-binding universal stress UspA family protein